MIQIQFDLGHKMYQDIRNYTSYVIKREIYPDVYYDIWRQLYQNIDNIMWDKTCAKIGTGTVYNARY